MDYKYTTKFNFEIFAADIVKLSSLPPKEKSLASLNEFLPNLDEKKDIDLLSIAFNGAVVNMFNKNDDGISSETAVKIIDYFKNKPINIEHDRSRIVGHITSAGFTNRDNDKVMSSEEAAMTKNPYNLSFGGYIYKLVNSEFYNELKNSMNPENEMYQSISASWEIGFNSYAIAVGSSNIANAKIFDKEDQVEHYSRYLRSFGGEGFTESGERVYRLIMGEVYPLGIGLVENPAADVKGVIYKKEDESLPNTDKNNAKSDVNILNTPIDISQSEQNVVNNLDSLKNMEILNQIKEALAAEKKISEEVIASVTAKFADAIKEHNEQYLQQIQEKEEAIANELKEKEELKQSIADIESKLASAQEKIEEFENLKKQEAVAALINQRMEEIDSNYELDNEARKTILEDLAGLESDEAFASYKNKLSIFLKDKSKEAIAKIKEEQEKVLKEVKAFVETPENEVVAEQALEDVQEEAQDIPNNSNANMEDQSLAQKFAKAFSRDNVVIS